MNDYRWQDVAAAAVGAFVIICPWIIPLEFPASSAPAFFHFTHVLAGIIILAIVVIGILAEERWPEWVQGVLGLWLLTSPWALGYNSMIALSYSDMAAGIVLLALAASSLVFEHRPPPSF